MAPAKRKSASEDKPEQQPVQQAAPNQQELEKLRWRQYRIIGSMLITLAAVFAARLDYITPQFGLGIIIMLYVTQRFSL